jgi:hypothetical protein
MPRNSARTQSGDEQGDTSGLSRGQQSPAAPSRPRRYRNLNDYASGNAPVPDGTATTSREETLVVPMFGIVSIVSLCIAAAIARYLESRNAALPQTSCHIVSLPMTSAAWEQATSTATLPGEYAGSEAPELLDGMLFRRTSASALNLLLLSRTWPSDGPAYDDLIGSRMHLFESILSTAFLRYYDRKASAESVTNALADKSTLFLSAYRGMSSQDHTPRRDKALQSTAIAVAEDRSLSCSCSLTALLHYIALRADKITLRQQEASSAKAPTRALLLPRHQANLLASLSRIDEINRSMGSLVDPDSQLQLLTYDVSDLTSEHSPYFILSATTHKKAALTSIKQLEGKELSALTKTLSSPYFSAGSSAEAVLEGLLRLLDDVHEGIQGIGY